MLLSSKSSGEFIPVTPKLDSSTEKDMEKLKELFSEMLKGPEYQEYSSLVKKVSSIKEGSCVVHLLEKVIQLDSEQNGVETLWEIVKLATYEILFRMEEFRAKES